MPRSPVRVSAQWLLVVAVSEGSQDREGGDGDGGKQEIDREHCDIRLTEKWACCCELCNSARFKGGGVCLRRAWRFAGRAEVLPIREYCNPP